jgi:hypothetical protein
MISRSWNNLKVSLSQPFFAMTIPYNLEHPLVFIYLNDDTKVIGVEYAILISY